MGVPRFARELVTRTAQRLGYEVLPKWQMRDRYHANHLRILMDAYHISHVIDVGANKGQFCRFLRDEVEFTGKVDSFEPVPDLIANLLEASKSDPNWIIHPAALGASVGVQLFNVAAKTEFSSFLRPLDNEIFSGSNVVAEQVEVSVSTLDAEFSDTKLLANTFLKLDTQGFDLQVVTGGSRALSAIPLLQTEISFRQSYDGMPTFQESLEFLQAAGFIVADLIQVHHPIPVDGAIEFDLLMIRPDARGGRA